MTWLFAMPFWTHRCGGMLIVTLCKHGTFEMDMPVGSNALPRRKDTHYSRPLSLTL